MNHPRFDPFSFACGLVFLALALAFWLDRRGTVSLDPGWIGAIAMITVGAGTVATGWRRRNR